MKRVVENGNEISRHARNDRRGAHKHKEKEAALTFKTASMYIISAVAHPVSTAVPLSFA